MIDLDFYHSLANGNKAWCELKDRSVGIVRGRDALRYLNGQVTHDVKSLSKGKSILAAVLNGKGKFTGELWVKLNHSENLFFDAPSDCFQSLMRRLEMYIIADDVSIEMDTRLKGYYFFGENPTEIFQAEIYESTRWGIKGWEIWSPHVLDFSPYLEVNEEITEIFRIENGAPKWRVDFDETYFPQEAAWNETYGLHFAKGCYVGQEIVSRLRNVGRVNREIKLIICDNASQDDDLKNLRGEKLKIGDQEIAPITSITYSPRYQSWIGLATLPRNSWHQVFTVKNRSWRCLEP
jgi:folate-binding protein YgfZ